MSTKNSEPQRRPGPEPVPAAQTEEGGKGKRVRAGTADRKREQKVDGSSGRRKVTPPGEAAQVRGDPTGSLSGDSLPQPSRELPATQKRAVAGLDIDATSKPIKAAWRSYKGRRQLADVKTSPVFYGPMEAGSGIRLGVPVLLRSMKLVLGSPNVPGAADWPAASQEFKRDETENIIERGIGNPGESSVSEGEQPGRALHVGETQTSPHTPAISPNLSKYLRRAIGDTRRWLGGWRVHGGAAILRGVPSARPALPAQPGAPTPSPVEEKPNVVPDAVLRRFLRVEHNYYFPDKTLAFSDRGNSLATRGAHPEVIRSFVEIAQARAWDSITVRGTAEFRQRVWMEAVQSGMRVAGYLPSALDLAELERRPANNKVEQGSVKERTSGSTSGMRLETGLTGNLPVAKSNVSHPADLAAKARAFQMEKPGHVVEKHPELAPAYGVIDAAKKFAEANLPSEARDEFVGIARHHVIQQIIAGEAVKGPRIYLTATKNKEVAGESSTTAPEAADLGKSPRAKEVARER